MALRMALCSIVMVLAPPSVFAAAEKHAAFDVPFWMILPFVGLLLGIALLPMLAGHFWHSNLRKALVSTLFALPVIAFLYTTGEPGLEMLQHALQEYSSFIVLLFALYTISGGIVVEGSFPATSLTNTLVLTLGAALANLIGTTGASMVLIRPMLRINRRRLNTSHIPVFFIFTVSNLGGLLTPLGDPPLFLGFLRGVKFFWTFQLWPQWLLANGIVLAVFFIWDTIAWVREPRVAAPAEAVSLEGPFRVRGLVNFLFLAGVLAAVLLQSDHVSRPVQAWLQQFVDCPDLQLNYPAPEIVMLAMAILSLVFTSNALRKENEFTWGAIIEVAVLFAGIFVAMVPALVSLADTAPQLGLTDAWQYFWLSGSLSSFLDNAPTYVTFATIAAHGRDFAPLMDDPAHLLQAISCGAVFFGAMSYIGNGPNFMVKAIAEASGWQMPSFFGFMIYSCTILLPIFVLITYVFFWP